jgi:hypothetical protein
VPPNPQKPSPLERIPKQRPSADQDPCSIQGDFCPDLAKTAPEATAGIEPAMKVLQTSALPLGYVAEESCGELARRHDGDGDAEG